MSVSVYGTSKKLLNMLKSDGFKGNVLCHPVCKE